MSADVTILMYGIIIAQPESQPMSHINQSWEDLAARALGPHTPHASHKPLLIHLSTSSLSLFHEHVLIYSYP